MPAPANDNQADAIVLDSEFGSLDGTTVGSSGEVNPPTTGLATVTNGHDVWYKWRLAWLQSFGNGTQRILKYQLRTSNTAFRHVIRAYVQQSYHGPFVQLSSRGTFGLGRGWDQLLEIEIDVYNYATGDLVSWLRDQFIWVQIDAALTDPNAQTGAFHLAWGRSLIPSLGPIDGHAGFRPPIDTQCLFRGRAAIADVSQQNTTWFNNAAPLPAGTYRLQFAGPPVQLATDPSTFTVYDRRLELLYNDGQAGHDGINTFASWLPGDTVATRLTDLGIAPICSQFEGRFIVYTFVHYGGKIGIQFRDFYGAPIWYGPAGLPSYAFPTITCQDNGYTDNLLPFGSPAGLLWRNPPVPNWIVNKLQRTGVPALNTNAEMYFQNHTSLNLNSVQVYYKDGSGNPTHLQTANVAPFGLIDYNHNALPTNVQTYTIYAKLLLESDLPEFPITFDLTPKFIINSVVFNGLVVSGGRQKWSVDINLLSQRLGIWWYQPTAAIAGPVTLIEYPAGQNIGAFQFATATLRVYFLPPSNLDTVPLTITATDFGYTTPPQSFQVAGVPIP